MTFEVHSIKVNIRKETCGSYSFEAFESGKLVAYDRGYATSELAETAVCRQLAHLYGNRFDYAII